MERYSLNHLFRMLGCFMLCIMFTATAFAQQKTIKGTVVDATGEPLIGVNVSVKGTTIGIITDIDGNYTLEVPSKSTIVFSYIGYQTQEVAVSNQSTINVTLKRRHSKTGRSRSSRLRHTKESDCNRFCCQCIRRRTESLTDNQPYQRHGRPYARCYRFSDS